MSTFNVDLELWKSRSSGIGQCVPCPAGCESHLHIMGIMVGVVSSGISSAINDIVVRLCMYICISLYVTLKRLFTT